MNIIIKKDRKDTIIILLNYYNYNNDTFDIISVDGVTTATREFLKQCKNIKLNNEAINLLKLYNINNYTIKKRMLPTPELTEKILHCNFDNKKCIVTLENNKKLFIVYDSYDYIINYNNENIKIYTETSFIKAVKALKNIKKVEYRRF